MAGEYQKQLELDAAANAAAIEANRLDMAHFAARKADPTVRAAARDASDRAKNPLPHRQSRRRRLSGCRGHQGRQIRRGGPAGGARPAGRALGRSGRWQPRLARPEVANPESPWNPRPAATSPTECRAGRGEHRAPTIPAPSRRPACPIGRRRPWRPRPSRVPGAGARYDPPGAASEPRRSKVDTAHYLPAAARCGNLLRPGLCWLACAPRQPQARVGHPPLPAGTCWGCRTFANAQRSLPGPTRALLSRLGTVPGGVPQRSRSLLHCSAVEHRLAAGHEAVHIRRGLVLLVLPSAPREGAWKTCSSERSFRMASQRRSANCEPRRRLGRPMAFECCEPVGVLRPSSGSRSRYFATRQPIPTLDSGSPRFNSTLPIAISEQFVALSVAQRRVNWTLPEFTARAPAAAEPNIRIPGSLRPRLRPGRRFPRW